MPSLRQLFLRHLAPTSPAPLALQIEKAEGIYLYDDAGKAYIDLISGIGVSSLGHCHPKVVEAIQAQSQRYLHTMVYGEYILSPQVQLAQLLAQHLPEPLDSVYLVNSGTEAVEGAMKLAKCFTGRYEIIACRDAYHGSTQGAASLMDSREFTQTFRPLVPGIRHIDFNEVDVLDQITEKTAGVVVETVQGEAGVLKPDLTFIQELRKRCTKTGALLILDEIQTGMGRTGTLFAFEQYGIAPDVLMLAKGLGGGMPIGAFIASAEMMKVFAYDPALGHITTFGGHPVCCAAALATLQELTASDLIAQVPRKEALFRQLLTHPAIREIRSAGLMMAVKLDNFDQVQQVINYCVENGLVTDWFLFNDRSFRIAPPLIITEEEIEKACEILVRALETGRRLK